MGRDEAHPKPRDEAHHHTHNEAHSMAHAAQHRRPNAHTKHSQNHDAHQAGDAAACPPQTAGTACSMGSLDARSLRDWPCGPPITPACGKMESPRVSPQTAILDNAKKSPEDAGVIRSPFVMRRWPSRGALCGPGGGRRGGTLRQGEMFSLAFPAPFWPEPLNIFFWRREHKRAGHSVE